MSLYAGGHGAATQCCRRQPNLNRHQEKPVMPSSHPPHDRARADVGAESSIRQAAKAALPLLFAVVASVFLISASWNHFAPDVLGLAELDVRNAVGLVVFVFTIGLILRPAINGRWRRHGRRQ